eukprot:5221669-Karenia_brevis.AAC.1
MFEGADADADRSWIDHSTPQRPTSHLRAVKACCWLGWLSMKPGASRSRYGGSLWRDPSPYRTSTTPWL